MQIKNLRYIMKETNLKRSDFKKAFNVSDSAITFWFQGNKPANKTLRQMAALFSKALNLPIEFFDGGRALLEKDFEEIVTSYRRAHPLPDIQAPHTKAGQQASAEAGGSPISDRELSSDERILITRLREAINLSRSLPIDRPTADHIMECVDVLKIPSERSRSFVDFIRDVRRSYAPGFFETGGNKTDRDDPERKEPT